MNLELKTEQKQILSQNMIQSTEILQMTTQELCSYINEIALENPVIDLPAASFTSDNEELEDRRRLDRRLEEGAEDGPETSAEPKHLDWLNSLDRQNYSTYSFQEASDDSEDSGDDWKFQDWHKEDLSEYLWSQLLTSGYSQEEQAVMHYLLYCLDENGYLNDPVSDLASHCKVKEEEITRLLTILQALDPAGVCARSLSECLLLQIRRLNIATPLLETLITSHLETIAKNQLPAICKATGCTMDELLVQIQIIRKLNPKPGSAFCDRRQLSYLTPDVTVVKFQSYFNILLNDARYPDIQINDYYARLAHHTDSPEVLTYLGDKIRQAEWIKTCISQRNQTLLSVTEAIVEFQKEFFSRGKSFLTPLRLLDVAEKVGIHESTVSRAIHGKYLQCMWGIYPMNYFFPKKAAHDTQERPKDTVQDVKQALKAIIDQENKKKPCSDRILAELLTEKGFTISRRTVTKYREAMGLGDTTMRKSYGDGVS